MLKRYLAAATLGVGAFLAAFAFSDNVDPKQVMVDIQELRMTLITNAREAGTQITAAELNAAVKAVADEAIAQVAMDEIEAAQAADWARVYQAADRNADVIVLVGKYLETNPTPSEKFGAQFVAVQAYAALEQFEEGLEYTLAMEPTSGADFNNMAAYTVYVFVPGITELSGSEILAALDKLELKKPEATGDERDAAALNSANSMLVEQRVNTMISMGQKDEAMVVLGEAIEATTDANTTRALSSLRARLVNVGNAPAEIEVTHTIGDFESFESLRGKVVLIDFFAHWCGPCIASFPSYRQLYSELKDEGLEIVGVTRFYGYYGQERPLEPEAELERMKGFLDQHQLEWPVVFTDPAAYEVYGVTGIPTIVVVDAEGVVRQYKVGFTEASFGAFKEEIKGLIAAAKQSQ